MSYLLDYKGKTSFKRACLVAGLTLLVLLLQVYPVLAHAQLVDAEPAPGETVSGSPDEIRLTFNEPLEPGSELVVFGEGFQPVPGISSSIDARNPQQMFASPPQLALGNYTVQWTSITADGGQLTGSYSFGVTVAATRPPLLPILLPVLAGLIAIALLIGLRWRRKRV